MLENDPQRAQHPSVMLPLMGAFGTFLPELPKQTLPLLKPALFTSLQHTRGVLKAHRKRFAYGTIKPRCLYILCWSSSKGGLVPDPPASWLSALPSCIPSESPKASSSLHSQLCKMRKISTQTHQKCPLRFVLRTSCLRPAGRFFRWLLGRGSGVWSGRGRGGRQFFFT